MVVPVLLLLAATLAPFEKGDLWGYRDGKGRTVVEAKYRMAQPFTRDGIAAVVDEQGWAYIDRQGRVVLRPFVFDNGPDYFREGLARFVESGKIGYFNRRGRVMIPARFDFGEPFERGKAKVCDGCRRVARGEHYTMEGGEWRWIDRTGRTVRAPKH